MSGGSVLVTGAGGFVGSAIVRRLVQDSPRFADASPVDHVVALLRPGGSTSRLDELRAGRAWSIEYADFDDRPALRALLRDVRPRAVVHAALDAAAYREQDDERFIEAPLETLLEALASVPGARFLNVGSAWVLRSGDALDEAAPLEPLTPYARTKARADELLPRLAERTGVRWLNLRLFNMFGRYEAPDRLLPTLVTRLARGEIAQLTHGEQVRDFNDVDVMATAFLSALSAPEPACDRLYHVGSGRGTTVRRFADQVARVVGNADLIRFGTGHAQDEDVPCLVANPLLAHTLLGWQPDVDLEARIRGAVGWWLAQLEPNLDKELTA